MGDRGCGDVRESGSGMSACSVGVSVQGFGFPPAGDQRQARCCKGVAHDQIVSRLLNRPRPQFFHLEGGNEISASLIVMIK